MTLTLYGHPFSSYTQKALIALYENDTAFQFRSLEDKQAAAEWAALWPIKRFPLLLDDDRSVMEASVIVEYLDLRHPGRTTLVPRDAACGGRCPLHGSVLRQLRHDADAKNRV